MAEYSDKLKDPRWQRKRLEIMQRDDFKCRWCGDSENMLVVHHKEYIKGNDPWDYQNFHLITLCDNCHCEYHDSVMSYEKELLKAIRVKSITLDQMFQLTMAIITRPDDLMKYVVDITEGDDFKRFMEKRRIEEESIENEMV